MSEADSLGDCTDCHCRRYVRAAVGQVGADLAASVGQVKGDLAASVGQLKADVAAAETAIIKWSVATVLASAALAFAIAKLVH
jgi:hypothetical protein